MRSTVLRSVAALVGLATTIVVMAGPAEAATANVLYRSTSNPRISVAGRACTRRGPTGNVEITTALTPGRSVSATNSWSFDCSTAGAPFIFMDARLAEKASWPTNRMATAEHWAEFNVFLGSPTPVRCTPTPSDPERRVRIASRQQGLVTQEFSRVARSLSAQRTVTCPVLGNVSVSISFVEAWSAWA
jgi:hypothetical protein